MNSCLRQTTLLFKAIACCMAFAVPAAHADMAVTYPRHESGVTSHTDFYFELLREALERTRNEFGPYQLQYTAQRMNSARAAVELASGHGLVQVDVRAWNEEKAEALHRVPIAINPGLIGYRILLIRAKDQSKFSAIRSLADLQRIFFGLQARLDDVPIFEHNGLHVVKSSSYDGMFRMLAAGRFDALSRDIDDVEFEFERKGRELPELAIENTLLLRYPTTRYFVVSRTLAGLKLAARIEAGLRQMQEDGSFDEMFRKRKRVPLERFDLSHRCVISLENPQFPVTKEALQALSAPQTGGQRMH